jgi:hypothetical protein
MTVRVGETEREYVVAEALALAEVVPEGDARAQFQEIAYSADHGEVPDDLSAKVGELVSLAVETGRARSVHGAAGVRALVAVWKDTPQGRRAIEKAEDLNSALTSLRGRSIDAVRVTPTAPGSYALSIAAGDVEVRLTFDRDEATLRSINVGGGGVGE